MSDEDRLGARSFVERQWSAMEAATREERARRPLAEKVRMGVALYESARAVRPDWPDVRSREDDLAHHIAFNLLLNRASHVGAC
ncbi:MAG: hypothetical protein AAGH15_03190 [Myxococcota bacterium]